MVRERWLLSRRELFQCLRRSVRSPLSHDGTSGDLEETPAHRASRRAHRASRRARLPAVLIGLPAVLIGLPAVLIATSLLSRPLRRSRGQSSCGNVLHRPLLSPALCLSAGPLRAPEHVVSRVEGEGLRSLDDCFSRGRFAKMMAGNYMKILLSSWALILLMCCASDIGRVCNN